jgi:DNA-binding winged helix-turn-helix (wHTH) protein
MSRSTSNYSWKFERFRLSIAEKCLFEDLRIKLSPTQFQTLLKLIENKGDLLKKDELAKGVGTPTSGPNLIESAINALRDKLRDPKAVSRIIETGDHGYKFVAEVRKVQDQDLEEDNYPEPKPVQRDVNSPVENSKDGTITFRELWHGPNSVVRWALIVGVILTILLSTSLFLNAATRGWARLSVSMAQAAVLLVALVGSINRPKGFRQIKDESYQIAKDASERSIKYWRFILFTWVLLYIALAFQVHHAIEPPPGNAGMDFPVWKAFSIASDLVNNVNTLLIILCYDVLHRPIEIRKGKPTIGDSRLYIGLAFIAVFLALEIFSVIGSSSDNLKAVLTAWSLGSGIVGGIAVALFVGRLQSMFLGPPRLLIIALYSYIAIQPLYVHFGGHQNDTEIRNAVILINAALILKCLLYFYLASLFKSGRLQFYLVSVRHTYQKVGKEWQDFQQDLEEDS